MNAGLGIKGILHVLFKRKKQILSFFFGTLLVVVPIALITAKSFYQANSQIRLELGREYISDLRLNTMGAVSPVVLFDQEEQLDLAIEIIKGPSLAMKVVQSIGPAVLYDGIDRESLLMRLVPEFLRPARANEDAIVNAAVEEFLHDLETEKVGSSSLINIKFRHPDPAISANVTNTLVNFYIDRHLGIRKDPRSDKFFQEQFQNIKASLQQAEQSLGTFKQRNAVSSSPTEEKELLVKQIDKLRSDLNETRSNQGETSNRISQLKSQLDNTARDPTGIGTLREKLLELQLKESELSLNYRSDSRTLSNLRNEMASVKRRLAQLGGNKQYGSAGNGTLYDNLQTDLLRAESDLSAAIARSEVLANQLNEYETRQKNLDQLGLEFDRLQQQVDVARENHRLYLTKFEELRISNAMDQEKISSITVIEPARPPLEPMRSRLPLQLILALFVGLVGGIGLAFLSEMLNKTIERREDVEQELGVPVLASIPDYGPSPSRA